MSARAQRLAELVTARDALNVRIDAMQPHRPLPLTPYEEWKRSPEGDLLYSEATARLSCIPLDPPRVRAARRKAIS